LSKSVKTLIEDKIKKFNVQHYFTITLAEIRCNFGDGIIIFQGLQDHNADSIKSLEGFDIAWTEEAQSLSYKSLKLLRPTIRKPGSELWFTWNAENATDPIDMLLRGEVLPSDCIVRKVNYTDNPWFPQVLEDERIFDQIHDPDDYAHTWEGEYKMQSKARIFKRWSIEEFDTPKDSIFYFGLDFGFSNDPTFLVRCYIEGRTMYIDYEARAIGCEIKDTAALILTVPESENYPITADSSRPESISHLNRFDGLKVRSSVKGAGSINDGITFIKSFHVKIHPRCEHLVTDFQKYAFKIDKKTGEILTVIAENNADGPDALRYAVEMVRRVSQKKPTKAKLIRTNNKW
jgi:phage terminase large subunit